tara:strand:+ start:9091 stop:10584 length:1494 start_codon:yes stop_codon:yes gene_type:complete
MGLLGKTTHREYYEGNDFGNYQFVSLKDIINQFMIVYVGEDKIISKAKRLDVAFHAQRALAELSFDTFKSIKTQQIEMPPSLVMPLPHDYVNYTRLMWVDSSGIKHPIYPTRDTQNPFQIMQEDDGSYSFPQESEEIIDGGFDGDFADGNFNKLVSDITNVTKCEMVSGTLQFSHGTTSTHGAENWGYTNVVYQVIDVSDKDYVTIKATATAANTTAGTPGILRIGLSHEGPDPNNKNFVTSLIPVLERTTNYTTDMFDLADSNGNSSFLEWTVAADGTSSTEKEMIGIDVIGKEHIILAIVSFHEFYSGSSGSAETLQNSHIVESVSVVNSFPSEFLQSPLANKKNSSTWNKYKSATPTENNNEDYEDDTYWPLAGNRYGLDPKSAQINGSFYIDQRLGRIHFSSNISGKTVVLDYISDSLGTDDEMQVHKFAEEAMYKCIIHAILSSKRNIQEYVVQRYKKERFAAVRNAKLRLSNIKLEELTQILRGKSKQIKH